jgi:dolichol kinase
LTHSRSGPDAIEDRRQIEHLAPLGLAFLLPYIDYRGILLLALIGFIYALYVSPFLVRVTMRREEARRGFAPPKLYYVLAVLTVLLLYLDRIYLAAGVWAILAVGDALSSLVGRRVRRWRLPYNPHKSWPGVASFWLGAAPAAWLLMIWNLPANADYSFGVLFAYAGLAALYCALIETVPSPIDDNVLIVWIGWIVLHVLFSPQGWRLHLSGREGWLLPAAGLFLLLVMAYAWLKGKHQAAPPALAALAFLVFGWVGLLLLTVPAMAWIASGKQYLKTEIHRLTWALVVPAAVLSLALLVDDPPLLYGFVAALGFSVVFLALHSFAVAGSPWRRGGLALSGLGLFLLLGYGLGLERAGLVVVFLSIAAGGSFTSLLRWREIVSEPLPEGPLVLHGALFAAFSAGLVIHLLSARL